MELKVPTLAAVEIWLWREGATSKQKQPKHLNVQPLSSLTVHSHCKATSLFTQNRFSAQTTILNNHKNKECASKFNGEDSRQTINKEKRPYYRTLWPMYNVSDQNKTNQSVAGRDSAMKKSLGRHCALSLSFSGEIKRKICSCTDCKHQEKTHGCLHSLQKQADTITASN